MDFATALPLQSHRLHMAADNGMYFSPLYPGLASTI